MTEDEWRALVAGLRAEYERLHSFASTAEDREEWAIGDALALVGHCAYHRGEIRQSPGLLRR